MVAMNVWPTDAADGAVTSEARWRKMARHWVPSGVLAGVSTEMAPILAYPNLTVKAGACWVDGHYCELAGDQVLAVTANGLAVVRFDPAANTAELLYRDGVTVPAQNPNGTWEQPIALITGSALSDRRGPLIYNGQSGSGPRGYMGHALPGSPTTSITAALKDIVGMSVTFTADPTRRYLTMLTSYRIDQAAAAGNVSIQITSASNSLSPGGLNSLTLAINTFGYIHCQSYETGLSGVQTRKGRIQVDAGSCTLQAGGLIIVQDVGSAVAP